MAQIPYEELSLGRRGGCSVPGAFCTLLVSRSLGIVFFIFGIWALYVTKKINAKNISDSL